MKQVIFTLANARSGTLYLKHLFRKNVRECACRHEPFFDRGNPTMLGPAIYEASAGRLGGLRARLRMKRDYLNQLPGRTYLESNHAFLKSSYLVALEFFPEMRLVHLIRDPLKVAKSEAFRETWRRRMHAPFHYYRGEDGGRYFFWSLTGKEEIFQAFNPERLSLFQWYLIQWIEIENRAMWFLDTHQLHERCFPMHAPEDLNRDSRVQAMFDFLGLRISGPEVVLGGRRNKSLGPRTKVNPRDEEESEEVLQQMPEAYLAIFRSEPYASQPWSARLRRIRGDHRADVQRCVL
jgi:hypothetical protein